MNGTSGNCLISVIDFSNFTFRQLVILTLFNVVLILVNVITNAFVIYVLIKTKQISNVTCKLILVLSMSDMLVGVLAQPLFMIEFYDTNCLIVTACLFVSVFLTHVSGYTIAIIGIDRYIRIKYFVNFKAIWTTRVVLTLSCMGCVFALIQALMITIGLLLKKGEVAKRIYIAIDSTIIASIILLQIQTIKTSNSVHNESTISASERIDKKISKLSIRIMALLCFFVLPFAVIFSVLREMLRKHLNDNQKILLDFISCISLLFVYANSSANAILFSITNVKANKFFRSLCNNKTNNCK